MAGVIRYCVYRGAQNVLELHQSQMSGIDSKGPRYHGPVAEGFNVLIELFLGRESVNYTLVMKDFMGVLNETSGYYDEGSCLHSLQTNESDLTLAMAFHPLMGKNLKQFQPYVSDNTYIFSRYIVSSEVRAADFMNAFLYIYSAKVWLVLLFLTLVFWTLVKLHIKCINSSRRRRRKLRDDSLYRVLTQLFKVDYIAFNTVAMRMVSFMMTSLSFYILTYFTLSMKTDIVVVEEPKIVNTYDDLLARSRVRMFFPRLIDNFRRFELADPNTKERKLWQKSLKEVGGNREELLLKVSGQDMLKLAQKLQRLAFDFTVETVAIVSEISEKSIRYAACLSKVMVLYRMPTSDLQKSGGLNFYSWSSKDPNSKEYMMSAVHSGHYKSPNLNKLYKRLGPLVRYDEDGAEASQSTAI